MPSLQETLGVECTPENLFFQSCALHTSNDSLSNGLPYSRDTTINQDYWARVLPNEDRRSEFFNVAFTVSCRGFSQGFDCRVSNRSTPKDST